MSSKRKIAIFAVLILVVAAVVSVIVFNKGEQAYDYDLSEYVKLAEKDYIGIKRDVQEKSTVTEKEIDKQVKTELEAAKTTKEIKKGKAKKGDTVGLDYTGRINGKTFDGGTAKGSSVELGSGSMIDGFEDGIIGMNVGDTKKLNLRFPEKYPNNAKLSGKKVVFTIKLNSITKNYTPSVASYIKEKTNYKTVKEYRTAVKKQILKRKDETALSKVKQSLWSKVEAKAKVKKYPDKELSQMQDSIKKQMESYASRMGTKVENIYPQLGLKSESEYKKYIKDQAKNTVRNAMIVYYISQKKDIKLDTDPKEDLEKQIEKAGLDEESFKSQYNQTIDKYIDNYELSLLTKKVTDYIYDKSKLAGGKEKTGK